MSLNLKPSTAKPAPSVFGSDAAPIVYADYVVAFGANGDIVQLELGANCLVPAPDGGGVRARPLITAHLRMSRAAAQQLVDMTLKALELGAPKIKTKAKPSAAVSSKEELE